MPGVSVKEFNLAAYVPAGSNAIVGMVGPATKGPVNEWNQFTAEGNLVNFHGRPVDRQHMIRAAIRYLRYGNQLNVVRIAGTLLNTAWVAQEKEVDGEIIPIIKFEAASAGTWANDVLKINISLNGDPASSYNIYVLFHGRIVERYDNLTNSTVETTINNNSEYIRVTLHDDAGTTLPDSTKDENIAQFVPMILTRGDDGAFASTKSEESSTGGISAQNTWSYSYSGSGTDYSKEEGRVIAPGTLAIDDGTETFTDNADGTLTGNNGGDGRVNYRTGSWDITFGAAPTTPVNVSYMAGTYEVLGSSSAAEATDSGTASRPGISAGSLVIHDPRDDIIDVGDGTFAAIAMTPAVKIVPGSVTIMTRNILNNVMTVTDDGNGVLDGDVAAPGTIDYTTGAISFSFAADIKNGEDVVAGFKTVVEDSGAGVLSGDSVAGTINYQTGEWTLVYTLTPAGDHTPRRADGGSIEGIFKHVTVAGVGDNTETEFTGTLEEYPIKPGSLTVLFAVGTTLSDDGNGNITGTGGTGTIDYQTGEFSLTFTSAPALGFAIEMSYDSIILHVTSLGAGPLGNERDPITDGIFAWLDKSDNSPMDPPSRQWYRFRVLFNNGTGAGAQAIETFDSLRSLDHLVDTINGNNGSEYVKIERTGYIGEPNIEYDGGDGQKAGMDGAFTAADVIGTQVGPVFTGLQLFSNPEAVPMHFITTPGLYHRQIQAAGIELCENRRCVWVFSIPDLEHTYDARDFVNGEYNAAAPGGIAIPTAQVPYPPLAAIDSSYAFCSFSWLQYYDQYAEAEVYEPGEGDIMALAAQVDTDYESWYPIAGLRRGQIINLSRLRYSPTEGERRATYGRVGTRIEVINSFVRFIGQGVYLYGQRTMSREVTATDRLHVRWTANLIANSLVLVGRRFPFELNDEILWREVRASVYNIIEPIMRKRGVYDYRIVCDATTNTPEVIQNEKKVIAKLFIQFTEAAEEIEFQMIFTPVTVDFAEVAPLG